MIRAAAPVVSLLQRFLAVESAAGFILIGAAALALIVSNSGLSDLSRPSSTCRSPSGSAPSSSTSRCCCGSTTG